MERKIKSVTLGSACLAKKVEGYQKGKGYIVIPKGTKLNKIIGRAAWGHAPKDGLNVSFTEEEILNSQEGMFILDYESLFPIIHETDTFKFIANVVEGYDALLRFEVDGGVWVNVPKEFFIKVAKALEMEGEGK